MNKKNILYIIILIISVCILIALYFLLDNIFGKKEDYEYLKDYKVNEYISSYVSDESMAKIYLNDYIYNMYYDPEHAYELLDESYKKEKFKTFEEYYEYITSLGYPKYELKDYYVDDSNGYRIFGIHDTNGNFYAFKTKGVMQYSVYLDEYTVEIGD